MKKIKGSDTMCVIIYLPINTKISEEELRDAFDYNDDGAGIAWVKDGKVNYSKGYKTFTEFYKENLDIIDDSNIERVIHFRITSRGKTSSAQCHPFLLSNKKDNMGLLDYQGDTPVLFMNGTISNQKLISGLNDTASYIIENLYGSNINFSNSQDLKMIDKLTGAKWAIVETTGVSLVGDFEEDCGVFYSNLYHRWYSNYWTASITKDYDYYNYYGFDDLYDQYDDDKAGWENEEWYADWLEKEYGYDTVGVYYDRLWYEGLTPNEALNVALNYILEQDECNSETKYDEYTYCDDDVFYKHYDVEELLEDYNGTLGSLYEEESDLELLDYENLTSLADLFPPKEDKKNITIYEESDKKDYLNNINAPIDRLVDNFSDLIDGVRDYLN